MISLPMVSLVCVDCLDVNRALKAIIVSMKEIEFGSIKLFTSMKCDALKIIIPINKINNKQEYSKFMICDLHRYITTDFILCIQWDGFVINPAAWDNEWLNYDYIGSPWWHSPKDHNVGNGGASLRSKKFLEAVSKLPIENNKYHPEDGVCCRAFGKFLETNHKIKFAPDKVAAKFGLEGNKKYGRVWSNQFVFHNFKITNIDAWKNYENFKKKNALLKY